MRVLLIAAVALAGCASDIMRGFIGQPVSAVVAEYGMPSSAFDMPDGKRAFVWTMQNSVAYTLPSYGTATAYGNSVFATVSPGPTIGSQNVCAYMLYAEQTTPGLDSPAAWTVTGFQPPRSSCE